MGHGGARVDLGETRASATSGFPVVLGGVAVVAASVYALVLVVIPPVVTRESSSSSAATPAPSGVKG